MNETGEVGRPIGLGVPPVVDRSVVPVVEGQHITIDRGDTTVALGSPVQQVRLAVNEPGLLPQSSGNLCTTAASPGNPAAVVVGEARNGQEALALAYREQPGLVLLDSRLPGPDGFEVAAALSRLRPAPAVVLMSSHQTPVHGHKLDRSEALGSSRRGELSGATSRRALGDVVS